MAQLERPLCSFPASHQFELEVNAHGDRFTASAEGVATYLPSCLVFQPALLRTRLTPHFVRPPRQRIPFSPSRKSSPRCTPRRVILRVSSPAGKRSNGAT